MWKLSQRALILMVHQRVNKIAVHLPGSCRSGIKIVENEISLKPSGCFSTNGIIPAAGPFIFLRSFDYSGSDRIKVYISGKFLCILIRIDQYGLIPPLEEMPGSFTFCVKVLKYVVYAPLICCMIFDRFPDGVSRRRW